MNLKDALLAAGIAFCIVLFMWASFARLRLISESDECVCKTTLCNESSEERNP